MARAVIVAGNSKRFLDQAKQLRSFLKDSGVEALPIIRSAYETPNKVTSVIVQETRRRFRKENPLLVAYLGHGNKHGWALNDDNSLEYSGLVKVLAQSKCPVLVINDCCHAGALIDELTAAKVDDAKVGAIASISADQACYPGLTDEILNAWEKNVEYQPHTVTETICVLGKMERPREIVVNRWAHFSSIVGNGLTLGKIKIVPKKIFVVFPRERANQDYEEVQIDPLRWGAPLDTHFW